jgi:hypothetical protein
MGEVHKRASDSPDFFPFMLDLTDALP